MEVTTDYPNGCEVDNVMSDRQRRKHFQNFCEDVKKSVPSEYLNKVDKTEILDDIVM